MNVRNFLIFIVFLSTCIWAHQVDKIDHTTVMQLDAAGEFNIKYHIYWGQLAAFALRKEIDRDNSGRIEQMEQDQFVLDMVKKAHKQLQLEVNRRSVTLHLDLYRLNLMGESKIAPHPCYVEIQLSASAPEIAQRRNSRVAWYDNVPIVDSLLGDNMLQLKLRELAVFSPSPKFHNTNPKSIQAIHFRVSPSPGSYLTQTWGGRKSAAVIMAPFSWPKEENPLKALKVTTPDESDPYDPRQLIKKIHTGDVSNWVMFLTLLMAFWLGAGHALAPGHGKVMVASYLVGTRGRIIDAIWLGITVTATHVFSVVVLGILMWLASGIFTQERVFPWMTMASGALIFLLGMVVFSRSGNHSHDHSHHHHHHHGTPDHAHSQKAMKKVELQELLWMGISGGMVPCPSAMIIMLTSIALGIPQFGLLIVLFFSLGLAVVLVGIGIAVVVARNVAANWGKGGKWIAFLPKISGIVVSILGIGLVLQGAHMAGLITINWP